MATHIIQSLSDLNVLKTFQGQSWVLRISEKTGSEVTYTFFKETVLLRVTPQGTDEYVVEVVPRVSPPAQFRLHLSLKDENAHYAVDASTREGRLQLVGGTDIITFLQFSNAGTPNELYLLATEEEHQVWMAK